MKQHPVLFSSPMVKALLTGTKTQTRRVIKKPERYEGIRSCDFCCPYGQPGDRLWVRETSCTLTNPYTGEKTTVYKADPLHATDTLVWKPSIFMPRWASRITLEITDVRVQRVQEISEEDAIAEGCKPVKWGTWWQGYRKWEVGGQEDLLHTDWQGEQPPAWMIEPHKCADRPWLDKTAKSEYQYLWNHINGKNHPWESNPWVWALTFKVINKQGGDE